MSKKSKYKPLLFTTTVRNPSRLKGLLNILQNYNGDILTTELAEEIMGELIRYGLYRPTKEITKDIEVKWGSKKISEASSIGIKLLSDKEVESLLVNNPQNHKQAGFKKGWPSRFVTVFDIAKELGFVYFWINEKIKFSKIGSKLANSIEIEIDDNYISKKESHPEFEQQAFLNSLVKYQRNNPFVKVLNENVPLLLLLEVIKKLNSDKEFNGSGISRLELPLVIFWKNSDSTELYKLIKSIRKKHGYQPTWETIIDICINHIMNGKFKKFEPKSIMNEYPDEFIRKMRLTGLISLRGGGRFIDINQNEIAKVDYVLSNYINYPKFTSGKKYFKYASQIDKNLVSLESKIIPSADKSVFLQKWVDTFDWDFIKNELMLLASKSLTKDGTLKYLPNPVRLEFLTALALKSQFPLVQVIPNYPIDDEGVPTSTAGGTGNMGDIECFENSKGILVEVTMSGGRTQTMMEIWPIRRHLKEFSKKAKESMCYFVAPSIFTDSIQQIKYIKDTEGLNIQAKAIEDFLKHLENSSTLYIN